MSVSDTRRALLDAMGVVRWVGRDSGRDPYGAVGERLPAGSAAIPPSSPPTRSRPPATGRSQGRQAFEQMLGGGLPAGERGRSTVARSDPVRPGADESTAPAAAISDRPPAVTMAAAPSPVAPAAGPQRGAGWCQQLDWVALEQAVSDCTRCTLHQGRIRPVFGVGDRNAEWMLIGEAPGADEDRLGEPFVGRAGQLLNNMLFAIGLDRERVYIANIIKSRPPNNRNPESGEVEACIPYLMRQIELVSPRLIVVLGRVAAHALLQRHEPLARLRGRVHTLTPYGTPLIVTYHPAYLLRSPGEKRRAWDDLKLAMQVAGGGR